MQWLDVPGEVLRVAVEKLAVTLQIPCDHPVGAQDFKLTLEAGKGTYGAARWPPCQRMSRRERYGILRKETHQRIVVGRSERIAVLRAGVRLGGVHKGLYHGRCVHRQRGTLRTQRQLFFYR